MEVIVNRSSGKRHLAGDEKLTLCGAKLVQDGKENASFEQDSWLDQFPEDYGHSSMDCSKCAEITNINE